jgi:hypothetical protein
MLIDRRRLSPKHCSGFLSRGYCRRRSPTSSLSHPRFDPSHVGALLAGLELTARRRALENQGDDAEAHVLVDPGEPFNSDLQASLFPDLADKGCMQFLVEGDDATGDLPLVLVGAPDDSTRPWSSLRSSGIRISR